MQLTVNIGTLSLLFILFLLFRFLQGRLPARPPIRPRLSPLSRDEWESYRQIDGRISKEKEAEFRGRVFAGVS